MIFRVPTLVMLEFSFYRFAAYLDILTNTKASPLRMPDYISFHIYKN